MANIPYKYLTRGQKASLRRRSGRSYGRSNNAYGSYRKSEWRKKVYKSRYH